MAYLNIYWNDYKDDGLMLIEANISVDDKLSDFLDYCELYDVQYPALMNDKGGLKVSEVFNDNYANTKWLVFPDGTYMSSPQKGDILRSLNMDDVISPTVNLLQPTAQDCFIDEKSIKIIWNAHDENELFRISIYFSEDDGENYKKVVMVPGSTNDYTWNVPMINSDKCRIKVEVIDVGQNSTEQVSGRFSIINNAVSKMKKVDNKSKKIGLKINGQNLNIENVEDVFINIYSTNGKRCFSKEYKSLMNIKALKIPSLSAGSYILRLQHDNRSIIHRINIK